MDNNYTHINYFWKSFLQNLSFYKIKYYLYQYYNILLDNINYLYFSIAALFLLFLWIRKKRIKSPSLQKAKSKAYIESLSWQDFEKIIAMYYKKKGFKVQLEGGSGGDHGIDVLLKKKKEKIVVQCKHWKKNSVGVAIIREMFGVMVSENARSVIIVTSGRFTKEAYKFASGKPIQLICGNKLNKMMNH